MEGVSRPGRGSSELQLPVERALAESRDLAAAGEGRPYDPVQPFGGKASSPDVLSASMSSLTREWEGERPGAAAHASRETSGKPEVPQGPSPHTCLP